MKKTFSNAELTFENVWAEKQEEYRFIEPEPTVEEKRFKRQLNDAFYRHHYYDEDELEMKFDGIYAEEYFLTAFYYGKKTFFGVEFDDIINYFYPWNPLRDDIKRIEYDLVMFSSHIVAIIEVKDVVCVEDIAKIIKDSETFRLLCPSYSNCKIYIGLVTLTFSPELEQECIKHGIAVIKQIEGTIVINDAHLKEY